MNGRNVRQLRNVIDKAMILADDGLITADDLPPQPRQSVAQPNPENMGQLPLLPLAEIERMHVRMLDHAEIRKLPLNYWASTATLRQTAAVSGTEIILTKLLKKHTLRTQQALQQQPVRRHKLQRLGFLLSSTNRRHQQIQLPDLRPPWLHQWSSST